MPFGSHRVGADGRYCSVNSTELRWLGSERKDLVGLRSPTEFLAPRSQAVLREHLAAYGPAGVCGLQLDLCGADGARRPVTLRTAHISGRLDQASSFRWILSDDTEQHGVRDRERLAALAFLAGLPTCVTDAAGDVVHVNPAFCAATGYPAEELAGRNMRVLSAGHHDPDFFEGLWRSLLAQGAWQGEILNRGKDGIVFLSRVGIRAVADDDGGITHYVANLVDITADKAAAEAMSRLAFFDALTQLPNRRLLLDRLRQALAAGARTGQGGAVLFLDLDGFKQVNDTRGHRAGDRVLVEVARRLVLGVRESDTVARLGGDEFILLLTGLPSGPDEAENHARRIGEGFIARVGAPFDDAEPGLAVSASIGVSLFEAGVPPEELLGRADRAMYAAKQAGRGQLRMFEASMAPKSG